MNEPTTLLEAVTYFSDRDRALDFIVKMRWPNGVQCPLCDSCEVGFVATRRIWNCRACKRQFSAKVGTVFEDSPLGFEKWLPAMWMICNDKNGIRSYELHRGIGVTQKTAWFMLHRIRRCMQTGTFSRMMGVVEADETFIGGKAQFMHESKRVAKMHGRGAGGSGKEVVMGLLERHGEGARSRVKVKHVRNTRKATLQPEIRESVAPGSAVYTDAHPGYVGLAPDYIHESVDHAEKYVDGIVHTNGIENFWSLLKQTLKGTYVSAEPWHLFRYLDEQAFRFNEREGNDLERFRMVAGQVVGRHISYDVLTGKTEPIAGATTGH